MAISSLETLVAGIMRVVPTAEAGAIERDDVEYRAVRGIPGSHKGLWVPLTEPPGVGSAPYSAALAASSCSISVRDTVAPVPDAQTTFSLISPTPAMVPVMVWLRSTLPTPSGVPAKITSPGAKVK